VFVALVLQQLVAARQPHLLVASFAIFVLLVAFVVLWQAALWFSARDRYMWWYLSLLAVVSPALLALANQPYLVYSSMSLHRAYGTHAHDDIAIACFGLFLPVILAGFGLLWWRLINRHS
jgi:cytochrome bd-type quinol oxidase subunit 2